MRLVSFAGWTIPEYDRTYPWETGPYPGQIVELPGGGGFDALGEDDAPGRPYQFQVNFTQIEDSLEEMQTALDAIRELAGTWGQIVVETPDAQQRHAYGRCIGENEPSAPGYFLAQPVELTFEVPVPGWNGEYHEHQTLLNNNPRDDEVTNGGNKTATGIEIVIAPLGSNMTNIKIENLGTKHRSKIEYQGTIEVGKTCVIDCGKKSVLNDGSPDFDNLHIVSPPHAINEWLRFGKGSNDIRIERVGGDNTSTVTFKFYDRWK